MSAATSSFAIGVAILPLSVLALVAVIGALGFIPLFTGFVYLRNANQVIQSSQVTLCQVQAAQNAAIEVCPGARVFRVGKLGSPVLVTSSMARILRCDDASIQDAVHRLRYLKWYADLDEIVLAYGAEPDPVCKERLARAYGTITGEDIEGRFHRLRD